MKKQEYLKKPVPLHRELSAESLFKYLSGGWSIQDFLLVAPITAGDGILRKAA